MKSRLKQLGKDSVVYGLGGILAKGIGFFLLPVYTRIFTPADYGTLEMLTVLNTFLGTLLGMGMDAAQSFYFFEEKKEGIQEQARLVTAILQWRLTWGTALVFLATLLSPILNRVFFDSQLTWEHFAIAFISALLNQLMIQSAEVFRLLYKPRSYISITLSQTVISAAVAVALVVWLKLGILGFFIGGAIASSLAAIIGWYNLRAYLDWSTWHRKWWPKLVRFGAPLLPAGLSMYVLNTADRWFISHYNGQDALGIYTVGAKFAMFIAATVTTFRQAWWPIAMDAMHSDEGAELFRTIARLYMGVGSAAMVLLTAVSPLLVRWFTTPAYYSAYPIVGVLAWSSLLYGFFLIGAAGIWKREKTSWNPILMSIAALINVILDAWLVPDFGVMGAAIATSIAFFIWNALSIFVSERLWPVGYPLATLGLQIGIGAGASSVILAFYNSNQSIWQIVLVTTVTTILLILLTLKPVQLDRSYH